MSTADVVPSDEGENRDRELPAECREIVEPPYFSPLWVAQMAEEELELCAAEGTAIRDEVIRRVIETCTEGWSLMGLSALDPAGREQFVRQSTCLEYLTMRIIGENVELSDLNLRGSDGAARLRLLLRIDLTFGLAAQAREMLVALARYGLSVEMVAAIYDMDVSKVVDVLRVAKARVEEQHPELSSREDGPT